MPGYERLLRDFTGIVVTESRVESILSDGITLCFCLAPIPVPIQWKTMFHLISEDKRGTVTSTSTPLLHGNNVLWKVVEDDIPGAKRFVIKRIEQTNDLFRQMLLDTAPHHVARTLDTSVLETKRLQLILNEA